MEHTHAQSTWPGVSGEGDAPRFGVWMVVVLDH